MIKEKLIIIVSVLACYCATMVLGAFIEVYCKCMIMYYNF